MANSTPPPPVPPGVPPVPPPGVVKSCRGCLGSAWGAFRSNSGHMHETSIFTRFWPHPAPFRSPPGGSRDPQIGCKRSAKAHPKSSSGPQVPQTGPIGLPGSRRTPQEAQTAPKWASRDPNGPKKCAKKPEIDSKSMPNGSKLHLKLFLKTLSQWRDFL